MVLRSPFRIHGQKEIATLKEGLWTILKISELNANVLDAIKSFVAYENDIAAEESRENARINNQKKSNFNKFSRNVESFKNLR